MTERSLDVRSRLPVKTSSRAVPRRPLGNSASLTVSASARRALTTGSEPAEQRGNQATLRRMSSGSVPRALGVRTSDAAGQVRVGASDAREERQADAFANRVTAPINTSTGALAARRGEAETFASIGVLPTGPGEPIEAAARRRLEHASGRDLSGLRVHTGDRAARSAASLGARAYNVGNDLVFAAGQYRPQTSGGLHLLAHEAAHALQHPGRVVRRQPAPNASDAYTGVIVPDTILPNADQMQESDFLAQVRFRLNLAGDRALATEFPNEQLGPDEPGLGDHYVTGIVGQSLVTGQSIEELVGETIQMSCVTAEDCLWQLEAAVETTAIGNRQALSQLAAGTQHAWSSIEEDIAANTYVNLDDDVDWRVDGGWAGEEPPVITEVNYTAVFDPTPSESAIRTEFPEVSAPLAAALVAIPSTVWGYLRPMLQGTIFHAIISAGYVAGRPAPAHPTALVNRGGGGLGRKRADLRDPATGAVIEIKPEGDTGGVAQLEDYIELLTPPPAWHEAQDIPGEAWPPTGTHARYPLSHFLINYTLEAWNSFATEPGMLYYRLTTTPGVPVYVPKHVPVKRRKYSFDFLRSWIPDFDMPTLPHIPAETVAKTAAVGGLALLLWAAVLTPGVPPPP